MSKKGKIILASYITAAITALSIFSWAGQRSLQAYRRSALYSARHAYEETVSAVDAMSLSLRKSLYATDGGMCSRICSETYAAALAAEAALSTLPFSTQELEQTSGFLGRVGDYAYFLSAEAAEEGFSEEQRETLTELSSAASELASVLRGLQSSLNDGLIAMDSREARLLNIGIAEQRQLSQDLLDYEAAFPQLSEMSYDGKYSAREEKPPVKTLTEEEKLRAAADFLGADEAALRLEYEYEGEGGRRCFSLDGSYVCVDTEGVKSLSSGRLIGSRRLDGQDARRIAEDFLISRGYEALKEIDFREQGNAAVLTLAEYRDGVCYLANSLSISVALDDGSIHAFGAENYSPNASHSLDWGIELEAAEARLPQGLTLRESGKVSILSPGGNELACYELECTDPDGNPVTIYLDGADGKQIQIEL